MKKFFFSIFLVIICTSAWAQQADEKVVAYFDKNWKRVYDSTASIAYYRTIVPAGDHFVVRDYFASGTLQMKAECTQYQPDVVRNGKASFYYENGKLEMEGTYKDNKKQGPFKE